ncbi:MAG: hypothetical protein ABFD54_11385 [Armatimonadota bacterium]
MQANYIERQPGPTPNGGAYSEAVFSDDNGNLVSKEVATHVEIIEYTASGQRIASTYGSIKKAS